MYGSRKFRFGWRDEGPDKILFNSHQRISQRAVRTCFEKQFSRVVRARMSKEIYIATCDFKGGGEVVSGPPDTPSESAHVQNTHIKARP